MTLEGTSDDPQTTLARPCVLQPELCEAPLARKNWRKGLPVAMLAVDAVMTDATSSEFQILGDQEVLA